VGSRKNSGAIGVRPTGKMPVGFKPALSKPSPKQPNFDSQESNGPLPVYGSNIRPFDITLISKPSFFSNYRPSLSLEVYLAFKNAGLVPWRSLKIRKSSTRDSSWVLRNSLADDIYSVNTGLALQVSHPDSGFPNEYAAIMLFQDVLTTCSK